MEKKWKIFHGADCLNCGDAVEVYSQCPEDKDTEFETWVYDGEDVRCVAQCGFETCTIVDEDQAGIQEGNINELDNNKP